MKRPFIAVEDVAVANGTYFIDCSSQDRAIIGLSSENVGDITAGTMTFRAKLQGESKYQSINVANSIDFSAYASLAIPDVAIQSLEVTTLGLTGAGLGATAKLVIKST